MKQKGQSLDWPSCLSLRGAPRAIRTPDPLVRSQVLYPAELWAHCKSAALYRLQRRMQVLSQIFRTFVDERTYRLHAEIS
jgi:hypothetical protein